MANDDSLSAQNVRPTIVGAINRFVKLINDRDIINGGQFVWSNHYDEKLRALALTLINSDPKLNALWNTVRPTLVPSDNRKQIRGQAPPAQQSLLDDLVEVATAPIARPGPQSTLNSRKEFSDIKKVALADQDPRAAIAIRSRRSR